jgi:hypothetical protein
MNKTCLIFRINKNFCSSITPPIITYLVPLSPRHSFYSATEFSSWAPTLTFFIQCCSFFYCPLFIREWHTFLIFNLTHFSYHVAPRSQWKYSWNQPSFNPYWLQYIASDGFTYRSNWLFLNRPSWACSWPSATFSDLDMLTPCPRSMFLTHFLFI